MSHVVIMLIMMKHLYSTCSAISGPENIIKIALKTIT